jgi:N-hydroxyarylamine O-acetyltransferase
MNTANFDLDAYMARVGYHGGRQPTLATLLSVVLAQAQTIAYENVDVLLGKRIDLDIAALQRKMVAGGRGGYCFEQNLLLRAALSAIGFVVTSRMGRVVRGMDPGAPRTAPHIALWVETEEGPFIVDLGFGSLTLTGALEVRDGVPQRTPHGVFRICQTGEDWTIEAELGGIWESLFRILPRVSLEADHEVANWYTSTHPTSLFVNNLIAARPGPEGTRVTLFNGRVNVRRPGAEVERRLIETDVDFHSAFADLFGLSLDATDIAATLDILDRKGNRGIGNPIF